MINLSATVATWYTQRQPTLNLFSETREKERRISIHEIVNLNANEKSRSGMSAHNTTSLLKLARRNGKDLPAYLVNLIREPHRDNARRFIRRWRKAKGIR